MGIRPTIECRYRARLATICLHETWHYVNKNKYPQYQHGYLPTLKNPHCQMARITTMPTWLFDIVAFLC